MAIACHHHNEFHNNVKTFFKILSLLGFLKLCVSKRIFVTLTKATNYGFIDLRPILVSSQKMAQTRVRPNKSFLLRLDSLPDEFKNRPAKVIPSPAEDDIEEILLEEPKQESVDTSENLKESENETETSKEEEQGESGDTEGKEKGQKVEGAEDGNEIKDTESQEQSTKSHESVESPESSEITEETKVTEEPNQAMEIEDIEGETEPIPDVESVVDDLEELPFFRV